MYFLSEIRPEDSYGDGVRRRLSRILGAPVRGDENPDGTRPDGVITATSSDNTPIPYMFMELKREFGEGGCDPTSQVSLSMRRSWIHETRKALREKCCCPTFLIAAGGPWLTVMGSVFTDKFIVQCLTDARWMALSSTEEDNRVYYNARVLIALRNCLQGLQKYYNELNLVPGSPILPNKPHPRYYPHLTSFTKDGTTTHFKYLKSLEDDPTCITYLAKITGQDDVTPLATGGSDKVVVKFVASYGAHVHKFLANKGWAPTLRYYGSLRGAGLSDDFTGPARSALPGLRLHSPMHIVVMDYVITRSPLPEDAYSQIESVLTLLHAQGYVFGDLREPNILFDTGGVKFIDFNWCGRYVQKIRDEDLADGRQKQIENMDHVQVGDEHYAYYPLSMSTIKGMWASGMEPLTPILPEHDWEMLKKLKLLGAA
ncbi:hypothetical protein BJV78DRAFT_1159738 [Lactifluus subvellereus]|nr:hypothetical protein BJV78DRAFT_1159738 [Lactifluus subvellereus]